MQCSVDGGRAQRVGLYCSTPVIVHLGSRPLCALPADHARSRSVGWIGSGRGQSEAPGAQQAVSRGRSLHTGPG
ncbi:hypothetical protein PGIGA_G00230870 [Pangasianodon gigas]|uniref:Uncharacterized protein n=1 Tax=Pangasianodon gigas TaxID=30993 RepID=A0ACC5WKT8_PANGG|nr:hypothetical protein [Pangasianodon gigas]